MPPAWAGSPSSCCPTAGARSRSRKAGNSGSPTSATSYGAAARGFRLRPSPPGSAPSLTIRSGTPSQAVSAPGDCPTERRAGRAGSVQPSEAMRHPARADERISARQTARARSGEMNVRIRLLDAQCGAYNAIGLEAVTRRGVPSGWRPQPLIGRMSCPKRRLQRPRPRDRKRRPRSSPALQQPHRSRW